MIVEATRVPRGAAVDADVCIVGAGAAGITIARELAKRPGVVCLLESGRFEFDAATQALYDGESLGTLLEPARTNYLLETRLRYFGGSTNHWGGQCLPFDDVDFRARSWVPHSGWPLTRDELEPYYRRAFSVCEITPRSDDLPSAQVPPHELLTLSEGIGFTTKHFYKSPPTRFGERYRDALVGAPNVHLHLGATVVDVHAGEGRRVEHVEVATLAGHRYRVRARHFVLAAGGIENARLLLSADRAQPGRLGNRTDLVGRFFMDHPGAVYGMVSLWKPRAMPLLFLQEPVRQSILWPTEETQRRFLLLNGGVQLWAMSPNDRRANEGRQFATAPWALDHPEDPTAGPDAAHVAWVFVRSEPVPNPQSRVMLSTERDALGIPRVRLDWRLTEGDHANAMELLRLLARALGNRSTGRLRVLADDAKPWPYGTGASHHMGTTRMSADPAKGVVDADCRVHGTENLFVAGSSVFPTASFINPTLTITALALRLADDLARRLG